MIKRYILMFLALLPLIATAKNQSILITAFEPFLNHKTNASWEALEQLPNTLSNIKIIKVKLPVSYQRSRSALYKAIDKYQPTAIVSLGLNDKAKTVQLEKVAHNFDNSKARDNDGVVLLGKKISNAGPTTFNSTLPLQKIKQAMTALNIPVAYSNSAGNYVCNHVFYSLQEKTSSSSRPIQSGFVHVPNAETLSTDTVKNALEIIIKNTMASA